jgi:gamma-glutamyl:cysteine ligase YbdK (ATP-grasp superfamily)
MEHKFQVREAPHTIGIEEELMILDAESLELVNAIESLLEPAPDLLDRGNGAARQVVVYEANHDLREVVAEIVAATAV